MSIDVRAPFRLIEKKKDETTIKVAVKAPPQAMIVRLAIDPADAQHARDWFILRSSDKSIEVGRSVKDDHTPGDQFVDLLFEGLDPSLSYSLELAPETGKKRLLFEDVPYAELSGVIHKLPPEPMPVTPAPDGELRIRIDVDPADAKEANDSFRLFSDEGFEATKMVKDDQKAGDQFVDLHFEKLPRDHHYSLEINGDLSFASVPYGELAHLSGDLAEPGLEVETMSDANVVPGHVKPEELA